MTVARGLSRNKEARLTRISALQMWRHDVSPRNQEPDQRLSDDDELDNVTYDHGCSNNLQSLYSHGKKVQRSLVCQTKSLKEKERVCGAHAVNFRERKPSASLEKLAVSSSRYDIGMDGFEENHVSVQSQPRKVQFSDSGDESISDEGSYNYNFERRNQDGACAWSAVREQVNELACLHTKTPRTLIPSDVYEVKKGHRIGRGRAKPKFSIHSLSHDEELPRFHEVKGRNEDIFKEVSEGPARQNYLEHKTPENSMTELLEDLQKENDELPAELFAHEQRGALLSISELLDNLQDKNVQSNGASNLLLQNVKTKNRGGNFAGKRMLPNLGTRTLDDEDPLEVIGGGMSSEDEEVDRNHLRLATQKSKEQTMVDLFQEAFSSSTVEGPLFPTSRLAGTGFHGRLQQIMQIEKDKHLEFLKQLQTGQRPSSGSKCINVQILSRLLEAKLTVCHCLVDENKESSSCGRGSHKHTDDRGTLKRTVIFSSKICDNVELDVGNLVRIHPPWKEVQVSKDEKIILCTYFSLVVA